MYIYPGALRAIPPPCLGQAPHSLGVRCIVEDVRQALQEKFVGSLQTIVSGDCLELQHHWKDVVNFICRFPQRNNRALYKKLRWTKQKLIQN